MGFGIDLVGSSTHVFTVDLQVVQVSGPLERPFGELLCYGTYCIIDVEEIKCLKCWMGANHVYYFVGDGLMDLECCWISLIQASTLLMGSEASHILTCSAISLDVYGLINLLIIAILSPPCL